MGIQQPDKVYVGFVLVYCHEFGEYYWRLKPGVTHHETMHDRYSRPKNWDGRSTSSEVRQRFRNRFGPSRYSYQEVRQCSIVTVGTDVCKEIEGEIITSVEEICGPPEHGREWFGAGSLDDCMRVGDRFDFVLRAIYGFESHGTSGIIRDMFPHITIERYRYDK